MYRFGGVTLLTDYAHNPDGLAALCKTAKTIPAARRLLILGQAGNRGDELVRELPRVAFATLPFDHVIIKEMAAMLRGRAPGEVPRILADELSRLGVPPEHVETAESEIDAVRRALAWASDGDLLVCPVHVSKTEVLALLQRLTRRAALRVRRFPSRPVLAGGQEPPSLAAGWQRGGRGARWRAASFAVSIAPMVRESVVAPAKIAG